MWVTANKDLLITCMCRYYDFIIRAQQQSHKFRANQRHCIYTILYVTDAPSCDKTNTLAGCTPCVGWTGDSVHVVRSAHSRRAVQLYLPDFPHILCGRGRGRAGHT